MKYCSSLFKYGEVIRLSNETLIRSKNYILPSWNCGTNNYSTTALSRKYVDLQICKNLQSGSLNLYTSTSKSWFSSFRLFCTAGSYQKSVPKSVVEMEETMKQSTNFPPDPHLLKVAIIGVPNSGKSTLTNALVKWRVCSVSSKVHTTVRNARAVHNAENIQLVFLDTPGVVSPEEVKRYKLKGTLVLDPELSLEPADIIAVIHDISNGELSWRRLHPRILRLLTLYAHKKCLLILNKVDTIKSKSDMLEAITTLTDGLVGGKRLDYSERKPQSPVESDEVIAENLLRRDIVPSEKKDNEDVHDMKLHNNTSSNLDTYLENREWSEKNLNNEKDILKPIDKNNLIADEKCTDDEYILGGKWKVKLPPSVRQEDVFSGTVRLTEDQANRFIKHRKGWPKFEDIFMVSALHGTGVYELRNFFLRAAYPSKWMYTGDTVTDQNPPQMVLNTVREKCLEQLRHNIPYDLVFSFLHWDVMECDTLDVLLNVKCKSHIQMRWVMGRSGSNIKRIAKQAEVELQNTFKTGVRLRLNIEYDGKPPKPKPEWLVQEKEKEAKEKRLLRMMGQKS